MFVLQVPIADAEISVSFNESCALTVPCCFNADG